MDAFKSVFKRLMVTAIVSLFMICLCATANASGAERTAVEIIRDIITDYGYNIGNAAESAEEHFAELRAVDPGAAEIWRKIYDYLQYANEAMPINTEIVPEGLPKDDSLCFVVLGYSLMPDGTMKPELEGRLAMAAKCAENYPNAYILCTGGGTASENASATEAGVMADRLTGYGISADRIITEDRSLTTAQNAIFSYKILSENYPDISSIVIVSSDYHIPWGSIMFQAECILKSKGSADPRMSVVDNAACKTDHSGDYYLTSQAAGLMEILEDAAAAGEIQNGSVG